ncbi:MAG: SDR family oxidoreductase [Pseudomonadota bacterium]
MLPQSDPAPRTAVVTGAGRGLGRALATQLVGQGLRVVGLGRNATDLDALATEHAAGMIVPIQVDVGNIDDLRAAFARIDKEVGPPDVLINNAAVYPHRDFLEETPESFRDVMEINLGGVLVCSMLAIERMIPRGHGRIVNVGTFAGDNPTYLASAYSVSKGASRILTKAMVRDLADRFPNIVITDWMPGALQTRMGIPSGIPPEQAAKWGAALALMNDPDLNGATFERDLQHLPQLSLKRRLLNALTGRRPVPRRIEPLG